VLQTNLLKNYSDYRYSYDMAIVIKSLTPQRHHFIVCIKKKNTVLVSAKVEWQDY